MRLIPLRFVPYAALALVLTVTLTVTLAVPAFAGDETPEDTAAGRLFREAWWSETGAGALDKAVEGYRKAVLAEGSEGVRARAQYRLAIVLQRMGRTEAAVRALESLAKDFGAQTELLAKARQRLDEWTAEDLRESFGGWYRRYQYSPDFQAKIVDLVLKLGAPDSNVSGAAREELLTIGEPALAALREHATSANYNLRRTAVDLIIRLGTLPEPEKLWRTNGWESNYQFWKMVHASEGDQRAAYETAAKARPEDHRARWILATLAGLDAMIDAIAAATDRQEDVVRYLLPVLYKVKTTPQTMGRLLALVTDESVAEYVRARIAKEIAIRHDWSGEKPDPTGFEPTDVLAWAQSDSARVRSIAWKEMRSARVPSPEAWIHAARALGKMTPKGNQREEILEAFLGQLRVVPEGLVPAEAVDAMRAHLERRNFQYNSLGALGETQRGVAGSPVTPRRVVAEAIAQGRGQTLQSAPQAWWGALGQAEDAMPTIVGWVAGAVDVGTRRAALKIAAQQIRSGMPQLMLPFADEQARLALRATLFSGLRGNQALEALDWDRESLTRLVETADSEGRGKGGPRRERRFGTSIGGMNTQVQTRLEPTTSMAFIRLLQNESLRNQLLDAAAAAPERFTEDIWLLLGPDWHTVEANRAAVIDRLDRSWRSWNPTQRAAGLRVLLAPSLVGRKDPAVDVFLRRVLQAGDLDLPIRKAAFGALSAPTLADFQAAFDLSDPSEAEQAAPTIFRLPKTEATYDAAKSMLTPKASPAVADGMFFAFREEPRSRYLDLVQRLLRVENNEKRAKSVVDGLSHRAEYLPLWREALRHYSPAVRTSAATTLGTLYDDESIKALALAVDDPDPGVRDAALKSLERIEKIEAQKDRWRKFAAGKAPAPGKK